MGRHERVAALARVDRPGLTVADLGCGRGRTVRALLAGTPSPVVVHALDHTSDLDDELLADERVRSRITDLDSALPMASASMDRLTSLNVVEHLVDPVAHLGECYRVLRPGGLLVLAHSDWDTALFTSDDDALTRTLVDRFVAEVPHGVGSTDGFMGRKLLSLAEDCATNGRTFTVDHLDSWSDPHRRFDEGSLAWKVALGMVAAARDDADLAARAAVWAQGLRRLADEGRFLFTVTDVAVVLRR